MITFTNVSARRQEFSERLRRLREFASAPARAILEDLLSRDDTTLEEITAILPWSEIEFGLPFGMEAVFGKAVKRAPSRLRDELLSTRSEYGPIAESLAKHPAVRKLLSDEATAEKDMPVDPMNTGDDEENGLDQLLAVLNPITQVNGFGFWTGDEQLSTALRICFYNRDGEMLVETTAELDDVAFLAHALMRLLAGECNRGLPWAKRRLLRVPNLDHIVSRLDDIEQFLSEIRRDLRSTELPIRDR